MKGMKKLLSILMVLTLVLSLSATAFAATVTIDSKLAGHTFTAYQIFTGTQNADSDNALADVAWGSDIDPAAFVAALKAIDSEKFADCNEADANTVVKALSGANEDLAKQIADAAFASLKEGTPGQEFDESTELPNGYYLIKDTTDSIDDADAYNDVVLQVTEDVTINYKTDVPSSDKSVKDSNDTEGSETEWQKTADWDIGDEVPFQLKGTLPSNYSDYTTYYLAFHDEQEDGLTFNEDSVEVFVDGVKIESGYEVNVKADNDTMLDEDCTFEVVFEDMKLIESAKAGSVITVEYTATLNDGCVIGNPGNQNTSNMEFSNDSHSDSHGETPDVTVVVFTYDLNVDKVDQDSAPLAGAKFALYKVVDKAGDDTVDPSEVPQLAGETTLSDKFLKSVTLTGNADDPTSFYAKGLDDGTYWLVETETPAGYNSIAPKSFTVTATHESLVTDLQGNEDFKFEFDRAEGANDNESALGQADIMNQSGATLPETGGIGTTIFYIAGAILVAGAVIILVTKRRVSGAEK